MASLLRRASSGAGRAAHCSVTEPMAAPRVVMPHGLASFGTARVAQHSASWRAPARQPSAAAPRAADRPTWTRAGADAPAAEANKELWSAGDMVAEGAERLRAFMAALPELAEQEEVLGGLLGSNPELVAADPATVRAALEALAAALGVSLLRASRLAARVPGVLERPAEEAGSKVKAMAAELGTDVDAALELYAAQPGMWAVSQPSIIRDRLDTLAGKLGLPLRNTVALVGKQALLWVIPPSHIQVTLRDIAGCCGLSDAEAEELVARVPPLLAVEKRLLKLSVAAVSASAGVPPPALLELLSRSLGLVALPSPLLAGALEGLAADLGVRPEHVAALMAQQPTLLCAQFGTIAAALEMLETALQCDRSQALAVLCAQPCLMYETSVDTLVNRIQSLATTFGLPDADAARALGREQPALLVVAPATVRSAASAVGSALGGSLADCLALAKSDPGSFMMVTLQDSLIEAWSARLQLEPQAVARLLSLQPALLELTATTLKARLESLAALFGVPAEIAAQLVLKHPALAAVPPNATITRAKNVSMALRISIQGAAGIIAKEPALLAVLTHASDEVRASGAADDVGEVGAIYEYYTMEWLQRQYKEMAPARVTSFSALDS